MEKLVKALSIFLKYKNIDYPTHCEHDVLIVVGFTEDEINSHDQITLSNLGFHWSDEYSNWVSFRYGSA